MAASTKDFISTLNGLIETCKDGEQGFREAAENVTDANLRTIFVRNSEQRARFSRELQQMVTKIGGAPESGGSLAGAAHRGWLNLKSAVSGKDDTAIINECERGEDVAKAAYQKALGADLPSDLRLVVEEQAREVKEAHDEIRSLQLQSQRP